MPVRYDDRPLSHLQKLARMRGIKNAYLMSREELIDRLRGNRKVAPPKGGVAYSPARRNRFERCVKKVSAKRSSVNPYAVCNVSVYGSASKRKNIGV